MKVLKEKAEYGFNVFLQEGEKYLAFTYGGNGDLYWAIHNEEETLCDDYDHDFFIITKENYGVYSLFEQLFSDIESINIYSEDIPFYIDDDEEIRRYLQRRQKQIEEYKEQYRLYNQGHYNELFDRNNQTVTWYSDETSRKVSNFLTIKKEKDIFRIDFYIQPHIDGYDKDFHSIGYIPVRFRNSGSTYDPFNALFMKMYHALKEVDDVNDFGHQIHIEECLYQQVKVKTLLPK